MDPVQGSPLLSEKKTPHFSLISRVIFNEGSHWWTHSEHVEPTHSGHIEPTCSEHVEHTCSEHVEHACSEQYKYQLETIIANMHYITMGSENST